MDGNQVPWHCDDCNQVFMVDKQELLEAQKMGALVLCPECDDDDDLILLDGDEYDEFWHVGDEDSGI